MSWISPRYRFLGYAQQASQVLLTERPSLQHSFIRQPVDTQTAQDFGALACPDLGVSFRDQSQVHGHFAAQFQGFAWWLVHGDRLVGDLAWLACKARLLIDQLLYTTGQYHRLHGR
jgi:hypothetical protein